MFNFLKEKLRKTVGKLSEKINSEGKEETTEEVVEKPADDIVKEYQKAKAKKAKKLPKGIQIEQKTEEQLKKEAEQELESRQKLKSEEEEEFKKEEELLKKDSFLSRFKGAFKKKPKKAEEKPAEPSEEETKEIPPAETTEEARPPSPSLPPAETKPAEVAEEKFEETPAEEGKGVFYKIKQKVTTKRINEGQFDNIFYDMELALMENNVAVEVIEKIKGDLKQNLVDKPLRRSQISIIIEKTLKDSIKGLFDVNKFNLLEKVKEKKPYIICFFGINGSGKTTTIAKIAKLLMSNNLSCVMAASDTFRAASIEQLQQHADNLNIKLIKHDYGADPAAVAYDAIEHAKAKAIDVVLIDTAGRMHSNENLMDEMKKIIRVANPDLKLFIGESITGNDCVEQAKEFNDAVGIDAIILAKADIDEKGGAAVSVSYVTKKPILYLGVGQNYEDLRPFDPDTIINSLGLEA